MSSRTTTKYYCDRCGAEIHKGEFPHVLLNEVLIRHHTGLCEATRSINNADLCKNCGKEFFDWFERRLPSFTCGQPLRGENDG